MEPIHKFNNGMGATLCNTCSKTISVGHIDEVQCQDCKDNRYIYWKCSKCGSHHKSDKKKRWSMDMCDCKESGVDAEEYYSRWLGDATETSIKEYEDYITAKRK